MPSDALDERSSPSLLTFGRVDAVRIQVGYRSRPDSDAYQQFLLDLPGPDPEGPGGQVVAEQQVLAALEQVLYVGAEAPRHYSLHQHRWHTSWGASPGALEIGLLVTTGPRTAALAHAATDAVTRAFRELLECAGQPPSTPVSRDAAVLRARSSAATAFGVDPDALSPSAEQHDAGTSSWTVGLRAPSGDEYDVVVGLVDGYAGSVRVRYERRTEVFDAVGTE